MARHRLTAEDRAKAKRALKSRKVRRKDRRTARREHRNSRGRFARR